MQHLFVFFHATLFVEGDLESAHDAGNGCPQLMRGIDHKSLLQLKSIFEVAEQAVKVLRQLTDLVFAIPFVYSYAQIGWTKPANLVYHIIHRFERLFGKPPAYKK